MTVPQDRSQPPDVDLSVPAAVVARALQDIVSSLAPAYGVKSPTWDELGETLPGQWTRHLMISAITQAMEQGFIVVAGRDTFAHLANDWDAQAAQIEREGFGAHSTELLGRATAMRDGARQLRFLIGMPDLTAAQ